MIRFTLRLHKNGKHVQTGTFLPAQGNKNTHLVALHCRNGEMLYFTDTRELVYVKHDEPEHYVLLRVLSKSEVEFLTNDHTVKPNNTTSNTKGKGLRAFCDRLLTRAQSALDSIFK